jgi:hypothetical protein
VGSLYEKEFNVGQVVSGLALAPLSAKDEALVRRKLAGVIGRGLAQIELSKKLNPGGRLQTRAIATTLKAIGTDFQKAGQILRGLHTGFHEGHQVEAATRIREALEKNRELKTSADEFLQDFCDRMNAVSQACLVAAADLKSIKSKAGQKPIDWYDDFTRVLVLIAERNGIRTTVVTDRVTGKPGGRFLELGAAFERLLYPRMRSPSRAALAKRLQRSLRRVK